MWRNYLTVAVRSLAKQKLYSTINILGLALGMAACVIILIYVRYEHQYDAWLPDAENVYQVQTYYKDPKIGDLQGTAYPVKAALMKDFPQVEAGVYVMATGTRVIKDGISQEVPDALFVDSDPFEILKFPFVHGDPRTALKEVDTLVLSETEARRWFSATNPVGKTLTLPWKKETKDFRVTGVIRDLPKNSNFKISMIGRWNIVTVFGYSPRMLNNFGAQMGVLYVRLKPGTTVDAITPQLPAWEKRNIPDEPFGTEKFNQGNMMDIGLVNIRKIHLTPTKVWAGKPTNSAKTVNTFAVVALLILALGCVNFVNLATARASQRAREVALRKVLGATRTQLVVQFIGESLLMASIAMLVGLAIAEFSLPAINAFLDADMQLRYWGANGLLMPIVLLILVVGLAGGVYPGLYLSRFQPAHVLKANKSAADPQGTGRLRAALVVGQFAISIGLMICTGVIYAQTVFARTSDPGFQRESILQLPAIGGLEYLHGNSEALVREISKLDGVVSVGRSTIGVGTSGMNNTGIQIPGRTADKTPVPYGDYQVDPGFFRTMGINLLAGRTFDPNRPMDNSDTPYPPDPAAERAFVARGQNIVINQLAAKTMGFASPKDAVGKQIMVGYNPEFGMVDSTIIGVVGDARFRSIREPLDPIIFTNKPKRTSVVVIRYSGDPAAVRGRVEQVWKRFAPDMPFIAHFSEDIVAKQYQAEQARAQIFAAFSILAVIIGCLGLVGLAAFTTERRTKEIGIRKVLGASTAQIVRLLVWQFARPVVVANLIAWPVAWWVMRDWLNTFNARISLGPTPFIGAGLLALGIAVGTIAAHSIRVARTNPILALRYE